MYNIPAVIFAGGKSSRMKEDKALLPFEKYKTLSEFQYKKLQKYFHHVYLSSKKNKFDFDCEVLLDTHIEHSPLVALVSIFEKLDAENIFILSVDAPLVDNSIFTKLFQNFDTQYDAIIAQSPHGLQPLCGIYNRSIITKAKQSLSKDMHKLTHLLKNTHTQVIHFDNEDLFTNLNFRHEYEKLCLR